MKTLNDVVAGDTVLKCSRGSKSIRTIKRTTDTQIIIHETNGLNQVYEVKFSRKNGYKVGGDDSWNRTWLSVPQDGEIEALKKQKAHNEAVYHLKNYPWEKILSTELLEQIKALLPIQEKD